MTEVVEPDFPIHVGRCIYCPPDAVGSIDGLSDEHVIPEGFNGIWVLEKASCKTHRDVTSAFEGRVLGNGLGHVRRKLNFRTKHRKRRRDTLDVAYHVGDERRKCTVPVSEHPGSFAFPVFGAPSCLGPGEPSGELRVERVSGRWHAPSVKKMAIQFGATALGVPLVDSVSMAQMIAKIGYGFAVACFGLDAFETVYVLPTIVDKGRNAGRYVGCLSDPPMNEQAEGHQVTLVQRGRDLTCYIRLVAQMAIPEYVVVVGRLREMLPAESTGNAA